MPLGPQFENKGKLRPGEKIFLKFNQLASNDWDSWPSALSLQGASDSML